MIPETIFRASDIRGIVGETLTPEIVCQIGLGIGSIVQKALIVGRDARYSSLELQQAFVDGVLKSGCDVVDIGEVPSPVLYFSTHLLSINSGVIITGSHNPSNYNGLKIIINGQTLFGEGINSLYQRIIHREFQYGKGCLTTQNVIPAYVERISRDVRLKRPLKIVLDCGNGVGAIVAPNLYESLGCKVIPLFCELDGSFPNHHPDPTIPENLQDLIKSVRENKADLGLAFDGDADRLGVVTDKGEIIWPDRQMMLFSQDVLLHHPQGKIIFDVKCTRHLANIIRESGGFPVMCRTGHAMVKAKLKETGAPLAGEMSGHIFFNDRWYGFDDGIYAGARLLEILSTDVRSVSQIFKSLPDSINTPELKLPMAEEKKFQFMEKLCKQAKFLAAKVITIDGLRVEFDYGFGLIRPSNTSPYLILRFEADTEKQLSYIQEIFRKELLAMDESLTLPF